MGLDKSHCSLVYLIYLFLSYLVKIFVTIKIYNIGPLVQSRVLF